MGSFEEQQQGEAVVSSLELSPSHFLASLYKDNSNPILVKPVPGAQSWCLYWDHDAWIGAHEVQAMTLPTHADPNGFWPCEP